MKYLKIILVSIILTWLGINSYRINHLLKAEKWTTNVVRDLFIATYSTESTLEEQ